MTSFLRLFTFTTKTFRSQLKMFVCHLWFSRFFQGLMRAPDLKSRRSGGERREESSRVKEHGAGFRAQLCWEDPGGGGRVGVRPAGSPEEWGCLPEGEQGEDGAGRKKRRGAGSLLRNRWSSRCQRRKQGHGVPPAPRCV